MSIKQCEGNLHQNIQFLYEAKGFENIIQRKKSWYEIILKKYSRRLLIYIKTYL